MTCRDIKKSKDAILLRIATLLLCLAFLPYDQVSARSNSEKGTLHGSLQWLGYSYHPGGGSFPKRYPLKLDKKAYHVVEIGAVAKLDYDLNEKFLLRLAASYYKDCAMKDAGFLHFGFRGRIFSRGKHNILIGLGPTLSFRRNWHSIPEYDGDGFYGNRSYLGWQYRFFIWGGELDYLYEISDGVEFHYSFIPGFPYAYTSLFGIRYRF